MHERMKIQAVAPEAIAAMMATSNYVKDSRLEHSLQELVKIRASQMNGCANCLHMHLADARQAGETEERIVLLDAWRESLQYTPRERAALAWTEALTRVGDTHAPDEDFEALKAEFSDEEIVDLTLAICVINMWNRLAIGFRTVHPNDRRAAALKAA